MNTQIVPRRAALPAALLLCALGLVFPARAQDRELELYQKLYSHLYRLHAAGMGRDSLFVLAGPGQAFDTTFNPDTPEYQYQISTIADDLPQYNVRFQQTGYNLSKLYKLVLDGHENPIVTLTPDQSAQLRTARKVLFKNWDSPNGPYLPSDAHAEYLRYYEKYENVTNTLREATNPNDRQRLKSERLAIERAWQTLGNRGVIAGRLQDFTNIGWLNGGIYYEDLKGTYAMFNDPTRNVALTSLIPSPGRWSTQGLWQKNELTSSQWKDTQVTVSSSAGGGASWKGFVFGASIGGGWSHYSNTTTSDLEALSINMEVLRVRIMRPWFEPTIFLSTPHRWRWPSNTTTPTPAIAGELPDGRADPDGKYAMPLLPLELLVARNVTLSGLVTHDFAQYIEDRKQGSGGVRIGPFRIGGGGGQTRVSRVNQGSKDKITVTAEGPQVIGWFCRVVPACPAVDPQLKFPSDTN